MREGALDVGLARLCSSKEDIGQVEAGAGTVMARLSSRQVVRHEARHGNAPLWPGNQDSSGRAAGGLWVGMTSWPLLLLPNTWRRVVS